MNKTQKIIMTLLILAILFSAASVFISVSTSKIGDLADRVISGKVTERSGEGGIRIFVEGGEEG